VSFADKIKVREYKEERSKGMTTMDTSNAMMASKLAEGNSYGRGQSPLRSSAYQSASSLHDPSLFMDPLRRKHSNERQRQQDIERELEVLDLLESHQPREKETSTKQLDGMQFPDSFTRSASKGPSDQRQKQELTRTMIDQIYLEREVEKLKQDLANRADFTCMLAFHLFDFCNRSQLSKP
jgi:hypothetical protein